MNTPPTGIPAAAKGTWSDAPPVLLPAAPACAAAARCGAPRRVARAGLGGRVHGPDGVRRADHVEVQVRADRPPLGRAERRPRSCASRTGRTPRRPRSRAGSARRARAGQRSRPRASSAATPLPLSLIPGPAGTESRWPPAMTTAAPRPAALRDDVHASVRRSRHAPPGAAHGCPRRAAWRARGARSARAGSRPAREGGGGGRRSRGRGPRSGAPRRPRPPAFAALTRKRQPSGRARATSPGLDPGKRLGRASVARRPQRSVGLARGRVDDRAEVAAVAQAAARGRAAPTDARSLHHGKRKRSSRTLQPAVAEHARPRSAPSPGSRGVPAARFPPLRSAMRWSARRCRVTSGTSRRTGDPRGACGARRASPREIATP